MIWPLRYLLACVRLLLLRTCASELVISDFNGGQYVQYRGDNIYNNTLRQSVTDARNVILYLRRTLQPCDICIDVGANVGAVSVAMWNSVGIGGRVISVEADPRNLPRLQRNLVINGFGDKFAFSFAAGDESGTAELKCYSMSRNGWQTLGSPQFSAALPHEKKLVTTRKLDDVIDELGLDVIHMLKIDVEGAELSVLRGVSRSLYSGRIRQIVIEINSLTLEGFGLRPDSILDELRRYGGRLNFLDQAGELRDIACVPDGKPVWDCVATFEKEESVQCCD